MAKPGRKPRYSATELKQAVELHGSQKAAADALGVAPSVVSKTIGGGEHSREPDWKWTEQDENATLHFNSTRPIRTLEDLYAATDVDRDIWHVEKWEATAYTTPMKLGSKGEEKKDFVQNFRIAARFIRKVSKGLEQGVDLIAKRLGNYRPRLLKPIKPQSGHLLELSLFDVHFGRAAWGGSQTLKDQRDLYLKAGTDLLDKASRFGIERIILPLGQDFFQVDNIQNTTTAGTPQQTNASYEELFDAGYFAVLDLLNILQRVAPVEVLYVPGNHDQSTSWHLCRCLASSIASRDDCRITFDLRKSPRKYFRHGKVIIGTTHGNEEKHADLGAILASECREWWADAVYSEFHVGHLHKRRETRFNAADTHGNIVVRIIPSLSSADEWHYRKGYVTGTRAAQAFVYGQCGLEAMFETHAT